MDHIVVVHDDIGCCYVCVDCGEHSEPRVVKVGLEGEMAECMMYVWRCSCCLQGCSCYCYGCYLRLVMMKLAGCTCYGCDEVVLLMYLQLLLCC